MSAWRCGIVDCGSAFKTVEELLAHQVTDHESHECAVCGEEVPEGYFAIKHGLDNHTRTEYVRAYDGDANAIRKREAVRSDVEDVLDVEVLSDLLSDEQTVSLDAPEVTSVRTN